MCSIVMSKDVETFKELAILNKSRGALTSSICMIKGDNYILFRNDGEMEEIFEVIEEGYDYYIGHQQAPTTTTNNIHPSIYKNTLLWHNGIIKHHEIERMKRVLEVDEDWDTELLHMWYYDGWDLSDVDGSFACVFFDCGKIRIFRNLLSPLYSDERGNFSSTEFDNSFMIEPNVVFDEKGHIISRFTTKNNPYEGLE